MIVMNTFLCFDWKTIGNDLTIIKFKYKGKYAHTNYLQEHIYGGREWKTKRKIKIIVYVVLML